MMFDSSSSYADKIGDDPAELVPITLRVITMSNGIVTVKIDFGPGLLANGSKQVTFPESVTFQLSDNDSTAIYGASFPKNAIPIGGTWSVVRPFNPSGKVTLIEALYRFAGISTVDGNEVAVITYQLCGSASGSGTMMLLTSDASVYRNETVLEVSSVVDGFSRLRTVMKRKLHLRAIPLIPHFWH